MPQPSQRKKKKKVLASADPKQAAQAKRQAAMEAIKKRAQKY